MTTGRSETRPETPIAHEDLYGEQSFILKQLRSPAMLVQLRARSKSLGMMTPQTSDVFEESTSADLLTSTEPLSVSVSPRSSEENVASRIPAEPSPSYEESSYDRPRLRRLNSSDSLDDPDADNDYLPPLRHPIQPRPEEGSEELPDYSCSVFRSAIVNQKLECVYPGLPAKKREWKKVYLLLFGTVMRMYLIQPDGSISINFSLDRPFREYTLQYAEAGIATDYVKRKYVLRVRAEGQQFLMQCGSEDERDAWVEAIQASASIALALEDRRMPKHVTLPRRRRGRYATSVSRSRPTVERIHSAPVISPTVPPRAVSRTTVGSDDSTSASSHCEAQDDEYIDEATALALCLNAGRVSRTNPRERLLISMLTAQQRRQSEWVIINGTRRKIDPKTEELQDPLPFGVDPVEDEHRARLLKARRRLTARVIKVF
jgi:hypothetical protein